MLPTAAFSPDYATARERFRAMTAERGFAQEVYPVRAEGFADGALSIDLARLGPADAARVLVVSSGLHGVEGFFGSAVQLAWLASLPPGWRPPDGSAVVLLHALNPCGFAAVRRFDEANIDLNRNFLLKGDYEQHRIESAASFYRVLDPYLNPPTPPKWPDFFPLVAAAFILRYGLGPLRSVLPAGQYAFPRGLFYGGDRLAQSAEIIARHFPEWVGGANRVLHVDFHTGLGEYSTYKLLISDPPGSEQHTWLERQFGRKFVETLDGPTAYAARGDLGDYLTDRLRDRRYAYLCAEFGTGGNVAVLTALRAENRAHFYADPQSPAFARAKKELLEAFVPSSPGWRWPVVRQGLKLLQRAMSVASEW